MICQFHFKPARPDLCMMGWLHSPGEEVDFRAGGRIPFNAQMLYFCLHQQFYLEVPKLNIDRAIQQTAPASVCAQLLCSCQPPSANVSRRHPSLCRYTPFYSNNERSETYFRNTVPQKKRDGEHVQLSHSESEHCLCLLKGLLRAVCCSLIR